MRLLTVGLCVVAACASDTALPVDPGRSTVEVDRTAGAVADGSDPVLLTITVRDAGGSPLVGIGVTVAAPADVAIGPVAATDAAGTTMTTLTSIVSGPKTLVVSVKDSVLRGGRHTSPELRARCWCRDCR